MPGFDQTGPQGMGPGTGRGFGPCGFGFGWRRRFGVGRGMGRYFGWQWPQKKEDKIQALNQYRQALEEEMEDVTKEINELEAEA